MTVHRDAAYALVGGVDLWQVAAQSMLVFGSTTNFFL
jgi:hypothetical protein